METAISIPSATLFLSPCTNTVIPRRRRRRLPSPSLSFSSSSSSFFSSNLALTHQNRASYGVVQVPTRSSRRMSCNCLFGLGVPELVVIAGVVALVFGPKKLPEVGRSIGKTVKSFQQAAKEFETELKKEPDSAIDPPMEKPVAENEGGKEIEASTTKESI